MAKSFFDIADIGQIDFPKLISKFPVRGGWNPFSVQAQYIKAILESYDLLKTYEINTALRLAHFFGQGLVETGFLSAKAENLNYSYDSLKKMWSHKFNGDEELRAYARKPEKIANRIYADRMGNGPEASGDGFRYRGRGFFQLTGKDNYRRYGEMAGLDLVSDPEMLERDLKLSIQVAAAFMQKTGLLEFADRNDVAAVSRGVNRGNPRAAKPAYHEAERVQWTAAALTLVKDPQSIVQRGGAPAPQPQQPQQPAPFELKIGSTGPDVVKVQKLLNQLGYMVGAEDGVYGPSTSRAVVNFQREHGLPITGNVDAKTLEVIDAEIVGKTAPAPAPQQPNGQGQPPAPEAEKPVPRTPSNPAPDKPLAQSRTIWGAIVAGVAGFVQWVQQQFTSLPKIATPVGEISLGVIALVVLLVAVALVIFARIDDRRKKGR
jgi:putative chitinase